MAIIPYLKNVCFSVYVCVFTTKSICFSVCVSVSLSLSLSLSVGVCVCVCLYVTAVEINKCTLFHNESSDKPR